MGQEQRKAKQHRIAIFARHPLLLAHCHKASDKLEFPEDCLLE